MFPFQAFVLNVRLQLGSFKTIQFILLVSSESNSFSPTLYKNFKSLTLFFVVMSDLNQRAMKNISCSF